MRHKILIVDDDESYIKDLKHLLNFDYEVLTASGPTAYSKAQQEWHAHKDLLLALVDLEIHDAFGSLSTESGARLLGELKVRAGSRIAVISGHDKHLHLAKAVKADADGYIVKVWPSDQKLGIVGFLAAWITAGSALRALSESIELRNPYTAGHAQRVVEYCKALIMHLDEAAPGRGFDLAACLVAAELHDLGKLAMPDDILLGTVSLLTREQRRVIERHVNAAKSLENLGPGFRKVAEIAYQHHRRYHRSPLQSKPDYPSDDEMQQFLGKVPRGSEALLEARVLHVAEVLDGLLSDRSDRPGMPIEPTIRKIEDESAGDFDPCVVRALRMLESTDRARLERIVEKGKIKDELGLRLCFPAGRLTAARLDTLLETLADVYLVEGKAIDLLAVKGLEIGNEVVVRLAGRKKDVLETARVLESRISEYATLMASRDILTDTQIRGLQRLLPMAVEVRALADL